MDELIRKAVEGDEEALTTLLEQAAPRMRGSMARAIPDRWRSVLSEDDVLQQTWVDAFRGIGRFTPGDGEGAFMAWLRTLARRNLLDAIRMLEAEKRGGNRRRVVGAGGKDSYVSLYEWLGGTLTTPSRVAARQEAHQALDQTIERLPELYRQVVRMYDLEHRPIDEVAEALGRSEGAVYMLRARAHRALCEMMGTASRYLSGD